MTQETRNGSVETKTVQQKAASSTSTYEGVQNPQFTGVVVVCNEARRLRTCLDCLVFCEQLIVVDLRSTDESVAIAREYGAEIVRHERVATAQMLWPDIIPLARNDWIIRIDPDEVYPRQLINDLFEAIANHEKVAMLTVPYQYYWGDRPVETTRWGGTKYLGWIFRKDRVVLKPLVHTAPQCRPGYVQVRIERKAGNVVQHYWVEGWSHLFEKHRRYISLEGEKRYSRGARFSWRAWPKGTLSALKRSLISDRGLSGGLLGIALSFFYAWYVSMSLLSLRRYQRRKKSGSAAPSTGEGRSTPGAA